MKTLSQYQADIRALMKNIGDIDAKCTLENRNPNDQELALKGEILDEVEYLRDVVAKLERQERISAALEAPANAPLSQPSFGGRSQSVDRPTDRFGSLGEQLIAVIEASHRGGRVDPRLNNIRAAATGLGEAGPADGGFLVQTDFVSELLQETFQTGVLAPRCRRIPISGRSNSIKLNGVDETSRASTRYGGILSYWGDEAALKTASKPKFRQIELSLHKLFGVCYATDELLSDAPALEAFIRQAFAAEFGFQVDNAILNGSGAGQPLGVLNAGCLVSVAKETGQTAATILAENIVKMYSRMFASSLSDAVWFVNQDTFPQLFTLRLEVGVGGAPIFMPAGGLSAQPYNTILGRPVIPVEQCATLGTVGDIIFADFGRGYILAEKGGIQADMSIHVQFLYDESVFRFVLRLDGQPVRASALTPAKGLNTQSHFVALATRA